MAGNIRGFDSEPFDIRKDDEAFLGSRGDAYVYDSYVALARESTNHAGPPSHCAASNSFVKQLVSRNFTSNCFCSVTVLRPALLNVW